ncbi:AAA family ATPase [Cellulosilyticum sp. I15G10I2]|uniref:AAA family ATPase n=1 Tax=Cellulosilyticum sp. I15G10I2 TaxID=1892843 RepID=UPI00085C3E91|nr:SMC family ATPase [Cellulosilyticum sp. I15G10I2]
MRPLRLVIKGFGTYLEEQDLDFTLLKDKNIFVITGDTGAGKTTVFDAINYALYGDASGKEREGISFRSDFATPEEETKVELWFALRDKEYYIKREPSYLEKKLRGEGEKEHKAYAELQLPDGKVITGIKPVTAEIEKILGINKDQFRQIVMIPQGEFKKLLTADSQEREKIFRKIFGTEVFEKIQNRMNTEANELDKEVRLKRNERDAKLRDFDCKESDEELFRILQSSGMNLEEVFKRAEDVIKQDIKLKEQISEEVKEIELAIEKLNKELVQGENINKKFEDRTNCQKALKHLEDDVEGYKAKRSDLDKARKALTVKGFEEKWAVKHAAFKVQDEALKVTTKERIKLKEDYDKAVQQLEIEKAKETEKKQLEKALNEAEKLKGKAQKYDTSKELASNLQKEAERLKTSLTELNTQIDKDEATVKVIDETMQKITEAEKDKLQLEALLKELKVKDEELITLKDLIEGVEKKQEEHAALKVTFNSIDQAFEAAKKQYETVEEIFRRGQAGLLAQSLKENIPCPVCGSREHPRPAVLLDETVDEKAVDTAKLAYEAARTTRDDCLSKLTTLNTNITLALSERINPLIKKLLQLEETASLQVAYTEVKMCISQNKQLIVGQTDRLKTLETQILQKAQLTASKEALNQKLTVSKEELKKQTESFTAKQGDLSAAKEQLKMIEEEFEGKVKTYSEILTEMSKVQTKLEGLSKAYKLAEENYNKLAASLGEAEGKLISIRTNLDAAQKEKEEAAELFKDKTLVLGFADYKAYKASCMSEEEIALLDKDIQQFDARLEAGRKLYEKACEEVKDLSVIDLNLIKENLKLTTAKKVQVVDQQQLLFARVQSNEKVLKDAKVLSDKIKAKEDKYRLVGELAKVMKGDNTYRISFERYVLAAYFDDIVEASNVRFGKMTGGRFELLRKTQKGDARSQQGLDLEIMDNYTGKARSVDTLSGGESFKASLAMALGLADVVQSYAGGIQLDTMFVDEGFGTLDPESLESAINCLVGLQKSGRLVGIISHVPELKERIDARLEVTRIVRGSRAIFKL